MTSDGLGAYQTDTREPHATDDRGDAPLTPDQEHLLALSEGGLAVPSQHRVLVLALGGDLDLPRLRAALEAVARTHDALRARLDQTTNGTRRVSFSNERSFSDLALRAIGAGTAVDRALDDIARQPLDLTRAWSRAVMLEAGASRHFLCLVLHRLGFDASSLGILQRAIVDAYAAAAPAPVALHRGAFASWLREAARRRSGASWLREIEERAAPLGGELPVLELPADQPRPATFSGHGGERARLLDAGVVARLRALAAERQVALDDVVLLAFLAWLQRRTNVDDPPIGIAIPPDGLAVGPFTRHAVLRLMIEPATPIAAAISRLAEARRAFAEGSMQGPLHGPSIDRQELVNALALPRDASRTPIYQIAFEVEPSDAPPESAAGVTFDRFDFHPPGAATDLTLRVRPVGSTLRMALEHATDLYDAERADVMLDGIVVALEALPGMPDGPIGRLPVMSSAERSRTLAAVNTRLYAPGHHAYQRFEEQAARAPDATAVVFRGETLSYGELNRRANRVAHRLIARGVARDVLVGIYGERSLDLVVAVLGVAKAGGAYLPLDPSHPPARTLAILEDAAPHVLLTQSAIAARVPAVPGTTTVLLDDPDLARESTVNPSAPNLPVAAGALAYVIFTSGSTGRPKGVCVEHRSFTNFLASMAREPGFGASDRILSVTTLSFDIAGLELLLPLSVGGSIEIADAATCVDGARLAARLSDPAITVMQATPATFRLLIENGWAGKPGLKVLCGGEALQPDLIASLLARVGEVWNMYGPTETTVWSTVKRLTDASAPVSIGGPIDNTSVYVLSPLREPMAFGAVGEIYIGGDGVARGYRGRAERGADPSAVPLAALTEQKFVPDPFSDRPGARIYQTGDIGRFLPDGSLTCLGRADFQIKIRGFRVEIGEIEQAILAFPGVTQAVVTAADWQPGDKRLVGYVVYTASDHRQPLAMLRAELEKKLPPYMVPSFFVRLPALPRTPVGKVDRRALPPPTAQDVLAPGAPGAPPADDLEAQIHASFTEVLGLARIGVDENFFDVGGESLLAARLARALEASLGLEIPLNLVFESPTIRGLAGRLRDRSGANPRPGVVVLRRGDGERRLFCVCGIAIYGPLARALPADVSVLGVLVPEETALFDVANLRRGRATLPSVEELAARYVEAIREEQPRGPYRLAGVSFGGVLAYEVARQLAALGHEIAFLGLLDALLPQALRGGTLRRLWWRLNRMVRDRARLRASLKLYGARLSGDARFDLSTDDVMVLRDAIQDAAVARYALTMSSFAGRAVLVSALDRSEYAGVAIDPAAGWDRAVRGGLTQFDVPGHHLGILQPPNVVELASRMASRLDG